MKNLAFRINALKKPGYFEASKQISFSSVPSTTGTSWMHWRLASYLFFTPGIYKRRQKSKYWCCLTIYGFLIIDLKVSNICYMSSFILMYLSYHTHHFMATTAHGIHKYHKTLLFANWCVPTTAQKIMKHFTYYWQSIWAVKYGTSQSYSQTPGKVQMNSKGLVKAHFLSLIPCLPRGISVVLVKYLYFGVWGGASFPSPSPNKKQPKKLNALPK